MCQIFIANLGLYNEGFMEGDWFELGQDEEELNTFLKEVVGINEKYEEWFIADDDLEGLNLSISESSDIYALNEMFIKYNELSTSEQKLVQAITEVMSPSETLTDAIDQMDDYCLYPDIETYEDLGYACVNEWGLYDTKQLGHLASYIDYKSLGRDIDIENRGGFTSKGYLMG